MYEIISSWMMAVPDRNTSAVQRGSAHRTGLLAYAPDHLKTQEMCNEAVTHKLTS